MGYDGGGSRVVIIESEGGDSSEWRAVDKRQWGVGCVDGSVERYGVKGYKTAKGDNDKEGA